MQITAQKFGTSLLISSLLVPILFVLWLLWPGYGQGTVNASATIRIDGIEYTSSAIWKITAKSQRGWGERYVFEVFGDAFEFNLGEGQRLFLHRSADPVFQCYRDRDGGLDPVIALWTLSFMGECTISKFEGWTRWSAFPDFSYVYEEADGLPTSLNFGLGSRGQPNIESQPVENGELQVRLKTLKIVSMSFAPTGEPLGSGMIDRHPWILQLERLDVCPDGETRPDCERQFAGKTYQQFFTTELGQS